MNDLSMDRFLIVNADDFGLSEGVNRGIIDAHHEGIVTSTSLMVRAQAAADAATLARAHGRLGVGLHIDLGEWVLRDGRWIARYEYADGGDEEAVAAEIERQVTLFVELTGMLPDHLDSHQHVHIFRPAVAKAVASVADRLGIGVRRMHPQVAYRALYGQDGAGLTLPTAIEPDAYVAAIRDLGPGVNEFGCHPGYTEGLESDYRTERAIELQTLCDSRVLAAVEEGGVRLITWREVVTLDVAV